MVNYHESFLFLNFAILSKNKRDYENSMKIPFKFVKLLRYLVCGKWSMYLEILSYDFKLYKNLDIRDILKPKFIHTTQYTMYRYMEVIILYIRIYKK